jgi:SAM-dependent methyltransferase
MPMPMPMPMPMMDIPKRLAHLVMKARVKLLYRNKDYLEAYRKHTDLRVNEDPQEAIGGYWERMGDLQIGFMKLEGMEPCHRMLDLGCGTLRAGRHFIRHLDAGNYTGIDISDGAISVAKKLVEREGLTDRMPRLIVNPKGDLKFEMFEGETFDYIMMQSVFTHLLEEHIEECFAHIGSIMTPTTRWYFTFAPADAPTRTAFKDFRYPKSYFQKLCDRRGFEMVERSEDYDHPSGQRMLRATLKSDA